MIKPVALAPTRRRGDGGRDSVTSGAVGGLSAEMLLFRSLLGSHLFVADGSRVYDLSSDAVSALERLRSEIGEDCPSHTALAALGLEPARSPYIDDTPLHPPPLASLSLNVMQACNMSCGYCYADEGRFDGPARRMTPEVAQASVDRLIAESEPGADLVLGYMGGEPLLNRRVVHETTRYADRAARETGRRMRFSLTTNLTTLRPEDAALFAEFPFTVSVSLDGDKQRHDSRRRMKDGSSAYCRLLDGLKVLERHGRPRHLAARATVTPSSDELLPVLDHLVRLGFDEVGFAAVVVSPDPRLAFSAADFERFLQHMVTCGEKALGELIAGRRYPFGNLETALQQIHRGTHRPYPCGAGAAYLSVGAGGDLFACHRLVDQAAFAMGSVDQGSDVAARSAHLAKSHVDSMDPCRSCWARYLCGGGCYHEVSLRGRVGCDYIRGWLEFCLRAYVELSSARPQYFDEHRYDGTVSSPTTVSR